MIYAGRRIGLFLEQQDIDGLCDSVCLFFADRFEDGVGASSGIKRRTN